MKANTLMNLGKQTTKGLKNKSSRDLVVWSKEQEIKILKTKVETCVQMVEPEHAQETKLGT